MLTHKKLRVDEQSIARLLVKQKLKHANWTDDSLGVYFQNVGSIDYVFPVPRGVEQYARQGKKILLKSIQIHGCIAQPVVFCATPPVWGTLLIVYDRAPTGVVPAVADVMMNGYPQSHLNDANSQRFRVVMRRVYTCPTYPDAAEGPDIIEEYLDMRGMSIEYDDTGSSAIANVKSGALYVIHLGLQPAMPQTECMSSILNMRLRFINA